MATIVDLSGLKTKEEILYKFGEIFELGGPDGNIPYSNSNLGKGWGLNWDALYDSLCYLDEGGIWGTSNKFNFPLEIEVTNYKAFKETDPEGFEILRKILEDCISSYEKEGKIMKIVLS